jgi:hypothetical protein
MSVEATSRSASEARPAYASDYEESRGTGWLVFAGAMLAIVGTLNVIGGIGAISNSKFFVNDAKYVFGSLNTWGWVALTFGVAQVLTAFGVWARSTAAAWLGMLFVSLNAVAQLLDIPAYPFWSLALFTLDILILYGLAAYGGRR